jgi:carbon monoxide dehydrogenase subunit G
MTHHVNLNVTIAQPLETVFGFVSDPLHFPLWNSAVQSVERTSGSTYAMHRRLPTGPAANELEVVALEPPTEFGIRTVSGPTPFTYRYRFAADGSATVIDFDGEIELGGVAAAVAPLALRAIKRGIAANLATLKGILETRQFPPGETDR